MGSNDTNNTSRDESKSRGYRFLIIGGIVVAIVIAIYVWRSGSSSTKLPPEPPSKWKTFVAVEGQPEPVPAEWVSTAEGRFAHSIKLPKPLPADSGYREGMTSKEYWEHLCKTQAGEFIYKTADNVEGFYFMRPPDRPSDDELKDRYHLEAPEIERTYQLRKPTPEDRGRMFVNSPWRKYMYVEEPSSSGEISTPYIRISGYLQDTTPMKVEPIAQPQSRYGMVWRGVRRANDRELGVAGSEWIVIDLHTNEVVALQRNFALTGGVRRTPQGIWWLNAFGCPAVPTQNIYGKRFYTFVTNVLKPVPGDIELMLAE